MSLTSDGKRMLNWAEQNCNLEEQRKVFTLMDSLAQTYYEKRPEEEIVLYEYDIEDFAQMKAELAAVWEEEQVMRDMVLISSVSFMKQKHIDRQDEKDLLKVGSGDENGEFEIPEYVYIF